MATAEDNFRVEVWDPDKKVLVEVVSRSPDFHVSVAAWRAAIRRRPGMLLIHMNATHIMERMVAPGEPVHEPQTIVNGSVMAGVDVALRDLRHWHALRACCQTCHRRVPIDPEKLRIKYGPDIMLGTLEEKLRCTPCKGRSKVLIEVHNAPRD